MAPLMFISRLQSHNAKMIDSIEKQLLTSNQKDDQGRLIEFMTLNILLIGLDPKLGQIVRASYPPDILFAIVPENVNYNN